MRFGLKNAPATSQRATDVIVLSVKWQLALVYLDYIVVFSKTAYNHLIRLRRVLKLLQNADVTLKLIMRFLRGDIQLPWPRHTIRKVGNCGNNDKSDSQMARPDNTDGSAIVPGPLQFLSTVLAGLFANCGTDK